MATPVVFPSQTGILKQEDLEMRNIRDSPEYSPDDGLIQGQTVAPGGASKEEGYGDRDDESLSSFDVTKSTPQDRLNMKRIGRKQQLVRNFRWFTMVAFVSVATASWELSIFTVNQPLIDGGRPSLIWSITWNFFLFGPVILSMAEMSSMAPICGAQYHWVSEFAPRKYQKSLSYFTGWMSTLAWQAGNAQGIFLAGTLVQTIIFINDDTYGFARWQGTLLVIAMTFLVCFCNIFLNSWLPYAQHVFFFFHVALWLCLIVPIWALAPQASASQVFLEFQNFGGWPNMAWAVLAGQLAGISSGVGMDTAAHMAEEIKDAGKVVPRTMIAAYIFNGVITIITVITLAFGMPDVQAALNDPTLYPLVWVLRHTMSRACEIAFIAGIVVILFAGNVNYCAAVARDLFAFSRDGGMPFSKWLSKVHPTLLVPVNSIIASSGICIVLSLLYIGNSTFYYALVSLCVVGLLQCYMFSIGSVLWRRIYFPETLPACQFSLGRLGVPLNAFALVYVVWAFFWSFWPQTYHFTAENFNWASVIFAGVTVVSVALFVVRARHTYTGPVALVQGRRNE